jgi:hypothetical protein
MVSQMRGPCLVVRSKIPRTLSRLAGVEQLLNPQPVSTPFLDLVELAEVGVERGVGLLVGPISHYWSTDEGAQETVGVTGRTAWDPNALPPHVEPPMLPDS